MVRLKNSYSIIESKASLILEKKVFILSQCSDGGNSEVFKISDENGVNYTLKLYPPLELDTRRRLHSEYSALTYLSNIPSLIVPMPLGNSEQDNMAIYTWLEGVRPQVNTMAISEMLNFVRTLKNFWDKSEIKYTIQAMGGCLSGQEILRQVVLKRKKLLLLQGEKELHNFILNYFDSILEKLQFNDTDLEDHHRCLNPGDFGPHNMILTDSGMAFIDMEYFGYDDPVKQISDVLIHPAINLNEDQISFFLKNVLDIYKNDKKLVERLISHFPAYSLRWAMIVLNIFIPSSLAIRSKAQNLPEDFKSIQLKKAKKILSEIEYKIEIIKGL